MSTPGSIPIKTKPPSKIAILPEPGMPNSNVGTRAPPSLALLADSGAITPRMSPVPYLSLFFVVWIAWPYAIQSITVPPRPGRAPTKQPIIAHLRESHLFDIQSLKPAAHPCPIRGFSEIVSCRLKRSIISGVANIANPTTTSGNGSIR